MDDGYTKEEHKMINETKKILGNENLKITATTVRVPIENCHGESINIEFEKDFNLDDVKQTIYDELDENKMFSTSSNCKYRDSLGNIRRMPQLSKYSLKDIYPIATVANGTDNVYVGRLRRDFSQPNTLNMWCVADNIRKGAASNAIQIMQKIIEKEV